MAATTTTPGEPASRSLKQLVLGRRDVQDLSDAEQELPAELMTVNMARRIRRCTAPCGSC